MPRPRRETRQEARERRAADAADLLDQALEIIIELQEECQELKDNLEEHFSGTERYGLVTEAVDSLDRFTSDLSPDDLRSIDFGW